ncbi:phosphate/phosphite/phosphonate ABC transporter substrate-binding protein [uncultured Subdoligranulum sp.]|uniref:phosphate/phosphite/phosphonate ABC transporter substrate-binding protein n=1 Tax=uncultured Subdoligranulum sp. TaxID=512298 RepID=UPI0025D047CE|nr:phosphate/phosphite/phosphonate ABC transporter substrate-binding protein [uncultured Subdoligranulum sp.]
MKRNRKMLALTLSALMTAGLLAGCSAASSSAEAGGTASAAGTAVETGNPGGEDGVFTIAYAPNESNTEAADARNGLAEDLGAVLGCEVEEIQASDYNAIIEALRTGSADMAYMGSQALALGVERTDLEPIVMKAEDGDPEKAIYHSVFITNAANTDINSIEDIKGRTMAFVDPDSTSGNLVPTAEIIQAFPDDGLNSDMLHTNGDFFEAVSFSGSHQAGLQAVVKGDVDVAPISDQILASEIANGNAAESDIKIIHESGAIPAEAMVVAEHVDQATRDKLTEFLTSYDNEQYFTDVIKVPGARFIECDMSDYEEIIELNKIINDF